jgi:hypothetical protein
MKGGLLRDGYKYLSVQQPRGLLFLNNINLPYPVSSSQRLSEHINTHQPSTNNGYDSPPMVPRRYRSFRRPARFPWAHAARTLDGSLSARRPLALRPLRNRPLLRTLRRARRNRTLLLPLTTYLPTIPPHAPLTTHPSPTSKTPSTNSPSSPPRTTHASYPPSKASTGTTAAATITTDQSRITWLARSRSCRDACRTRIDIQGAAA